MRHNKKINHLGRKTAHRKAMLSNMASSLIVHKRIETTVAKAKALRIYVEPLITRSKDDSTHSRRVVFSFLQDKEAVSELFREVGAKVADRPGGYTRIIKLGRRQGDNADMCIIELVDFNETMLADKAASKKTSSRRRRGTKKTEAPAEVASEAVAEEQPVAATEVEAPAEEAVAEAEVEATEEQPVAEATEEKTDDKDAAADASASEKGNEEEDKKDA